MKSKGHGTVNDDSDDEVHPLDQDYTQTISSEKPKFRLPQGNVLRAGVLFFLLGLVSLLVTAALLGIFSGARSLEAGGSVMHRVSGVLILVGGVLILIGYRIRAVNGRVRGRSVLGGGGSVNARRWYRGWGQLGLLLLANVLCWPSMFVLRFFVGRLFSPSVAAWVLGAVMAAVVTCLAMGAILHRGWWRGYCAGLLMGFVSVFLWEAFGLVFVGYSPRYGAWEFDGGRLVLMMQFSGMVGALYAMVYQSRKNRLRDRIDDAMVDVV